MRVESLCAILASEPHNLRPWEIRRLTWRQVVWIYNHPRDEKTGGIAPIYTDGGGHQATPKDVFCERYRRAGYDFTPKELDLLWAERVEYDQEEQRLKEERVKGDELAARLKAFRLEQMARRKGGWR